MTGFFPVRRQNRCDLRITFFDGLLEAGDLLFFASNILFRQCKPPLKMTGFFPVFVALFLYATQHHE
jgi:hypothetical protein